MTLILLPDVVKMGVAFLRAQPEVVDLCASSAAIRGGLPSAFPGIRVTRITDEARLIRPHTFEAVRIQCDCWGGNNRQAERLGQTVRAVFTERGPGYSNDEGHITRVEPKGLADVPDDAMEPVRERYILDLDLYVRPATA